MHLASGSCFTNTVYKPHVFHNHEAGRALVCIYTAHYWVKAIQQLGLDLTNNAHSTNCCRRVGY